MERREKTLQEGLLNNDAETKRWESYQKDVEDALENLNSFSKKLSVEVMVPIGSKAYMPGVLYHTNEVFLSHFAGIFSNCSVDQASTVCKHRLEVAKERLKLLKEEYDLFLNKLELPKDGALPSPGEQDIMEEYDEEKEKLWRAEHRRKMRKHKQQEMERENASRSSQQRAHEEIMNTLDELELMEELEKELEELQVKDDDTLQKLMSGEIKLPQEKKRISHCSENPEVVLGNEMEGSRNNNRPVSVVEEISNKYKDINLPDLDLPTDFTNNNNIPNSNDFNNSDNDDSDDSSTADIPEEVLQVERDTVHLSTKRRVKVFKEKIKQTEKSLKNLKLQNIEDMDRKANLLEIREYLMDYVEILKDEIVSEDAISSSEEEKMVKTKPNTEKSRKKKSISFAVEDEVQYIDKNATVDSMFSKGNITERDVIKLDPIFDPRVSQHSQAHTGNEDNNNTNIENDTKSRILEKVEQSCSFTSENQSQQDFNLIDKILSAEEKRDKTLCIKFDHSEQIFQHPEYNEENREESPSIIGSPSDIYKMFHIDAKAEIPKLSDPEKGSSHQDAYEDVRIKFLTPTRKENMEGRSPVSDQSIANENVKSILKNKNSVKQEARVKESQQKKIKQKRTQDDYFDFNTIVGEIAENPLTEPEPLPTEKFVDAHAPKKRISRFKQMRTTQS